MEKRKGEVLMSSMTTVAIAAACVVMGTSVVPAVAGPTTTVHLRVTGCEGCTFVAHDGRTWKGSWRKVATSTPVTNGKATITVPRKSTPTTSLEVVHPDGLGAQNAIAFVAFSWRKSAGFWTGGICWARQKGASARLHIVVTEFTGRAVPGAPKERFIRARLAKLPAKAQAGVNGSPGCPQYARLGAG
ncbi:MAG TPA: hypothetical protein PLT68_06070 [Actinomycetota bacterium]|nr:hypothetical protein [Actinomycetota bacterium]